MIVGITKLIGGYVGGAWASLIVSAALVSAGFVGGYALRDLMADADQVTRLESVVTALETASADVDTETLEAARDDVAGARQLEDAIQRLRTLTEGLGNETRNLAEVASGLELSTGYVRLLNDAVRGSGPAGEETDPTGAPAYSDPAPSGIGAAEHVRWQLVNIEQYNAAAARCNALIEWAETNLINDPLNDKDSQD